MQSHVITTRDPVLRRGLKSPVAFEGRLEWLAFSGGEAVGARRKGVLLLLLNQQ